MSSHQPANFPKGIPSFTQNSSLLVLNGRMLRSYEYNTNENDFQQDSDSSCVSLTVEILAKLKKGCFCSLIAVGGCYQLPDNSIGVELRGCPVSPVPAKGSSSLLWVGKHGGWPGDTRWVPRCPAPSPEPRPLPGLQQELLPLHAFSRHLQLSSARPSCCTASQWHSYPKSSEKSLRLLPYGHQVWGWSLPAGSRPRRRALLSLPAPFLRTKGGRKWFCFCRSSAGWWDENVCVHLVKVKDSSWV